MTTTARWIATIAVGLAALGVPGGAAAQSSGGEQGGLLLLVTETVERPGERGKSVRYWWSDPSNPKWTETDGALRSELRETPARLIRPSGKARISRIYQRPDLSMDNASSLASILGAGRLVVGRVEYRLSRADGLAGLRAVHVDSTLQLVDVASSQPEVLRSFDVRRSVFGAARFEKLMKRARQRFASRSGQLLGRLLAAASGPVGIETSEPLLAFHDLKRGAALDRIRKFLDQLDDVDSHRIRWVSEGLVALEINPGGEDAASKLEYVAKAVAKHSFDRMSIVRRTKGASDGTVEFDVELADDFGEKRLESGGNRGDE